jgi:hypothetical protein
MLTPEKRTSCPSLQRHPTRRSACPQPSNELPRGRRRQVRGLRATRDPGTPSGRLLRSSLALPVQQTARSDAGHAGHSHRRRPRGRTRGYRAPRPPRKSARRAPCALRRALLDVSRTHQREICGVREYAGASLKDAARLACFILFLGYFYRLGGRDAIFYGTPVMASHDAAESVPAPPLHLSSPSPDVTSPASAQWSPKSASSPGPPLRSSSPPPGSVPKGGL